MELTFTIEPSVPLEIKAVNVAEIEAKQREEAAAKKRLEDEAAALAAKKRQADEAAALAAKKLQEETEAKARKRHLTKALKGCKKIEPGQKRARCVRRANKKFGAYGGNKKPSSTNLVGRSPRAPRFI